MSYLKGPRLHFAGRFGADIPTGNNDATNYSGGPPAELHNFSGSGRWTLSGVTVTRAVFADGTVAANADEDPVVGIPLLQKGTARLVDLDPEQQLVSEIYGLQFELVSSAGEDALFSGDFEITSFADIWRRAPEGGDRGFGAFYQSEITNVLWSENHFNSPLLDELRVSSASGRLSIKFNVDGISNLVGRIVGTIGPAIDGEPRHHLRGRHIGLPNPTQPGGPIWNFAAIVDTQRNKLVADLGNSLKMTTSGGAIDNTIRFEIGVLAGGQFTSFGTIPSDQPDWYRQTAGVCEFPTNRALTAAEVTLIENNQIVVVNEGDATQTPVAAEDATGIYVQPDRYVFRLSAGESANATLYATHFGRPAPKVGIDLLFDSNGLQKVFPDAIESDLSFPQSLTTDANGKAEFAMIAAPIGTPRGGLDGQVCGVRWLYTQQNPDVPIFTLDGFFSVLVWTDYDVPAIPTWHEHISAILTQYGSLYPVMKNTAGGINLEMYDSVVQLKAKMQKSLKRATTDPDYMPVTRDLSSAKRDTILAWLETTGNGGLPNLGTEAKLVKLGNSLAGESKANAILVRRAPRLK
jgi:hypothetical protein